MAETDTSPKLSNEGIKRVHAIVSALLYYARVLHNRVLVGLSSIGVQHASSTEKTAAAINQILDQVATYPNDGITYRASDMILAAHSHSGFNNEYKACSHAGSHTFLSENDPKPKWNGAIVLIAVAIC